jgi:hypothetical protein
MEGSMSVYLADEVAGVELGDKRLTDRLVKIVDSIGKHPNLSVLGAMGGRSEMEAAYRFFANPKVTPGKILATHVENTLRRIAPLPVCLLVQDTTDITLTRPNQQVLGAGPMSSNAKFGAYLHPLVAFVPEGELPLGVVWQKTWARTEIQTKISPKEKGEKRKAKPIEEKESIRWVEGLRAALQVAEQCPDTQCVLECDSEGDIYELLMEPRETSHGRPLELLIRGCQPRATTTKGKNLLVTAREAPCLHTASVNVSSRKALTKVDSRKRRVDRPARHATVEIRACKVTLRPPPRPDRKLPPISINVILVEEPNPPAGQVAIQWILLTTLPIDTPELVRLAVEYYTVRWGIEVYFKTLKSGCRVEERQFEYLDRELNALAVYMLIAWRILLLCRLGRECPDLDCEVMFETSEWQSVYTVVTKKDPPAVPPKLNEMIRMIATLGGYVDRPKTEPGTQTLWIGLQRMHDFAKCYDSFGPPSRKK